MNVELLTKNDFQTLKIEIEKDVTWPNGGRSIYFRDAAGNCLELASPLIWGMAESDVNPNYPLP